MIKRFPVKTLCITLILVMLLSGIASAGDATAWGFMKKDGTYMEPMDPYSRINPYKTRDVTPSTGQPGTKHTDTHDNNKKKRIDPYENQYNNTYNRPRY